jgi:hypothetical protein
MTDEFAEAWAALAARLAPHLSADPQLREAVAGFGRALAGWAERAAPAEAPPEPEPEPPPPAEPPPPPLVLPPDFTLAKPPPPRAPALPEEDDRGVVPADPAVVARRCRLKAEAARFVAAGKRGAAPDTPADELVRRAEALTDCDLWMLHPGDYVDAAKAWDDLAGAFTAGAEAAELLAALKELPESAAGQHRERVLYAAAESQAMVWAGLLDVHRRADNDQVHLFVHVREEARRAQIYVSRYLRREDRVAAEAWPDLVARIRALREQLGDARGKARARDKGLNSLKYKLRKMNESPAAAPGEWPRVLELLEDVVAAGLPPSNAELRELLLPVLDTLPDDQEPGANAERVFRAVNEFVATRPAPPAPPDAEEPTADVRAVAELLRGREVVLIGGVERPAARRAIERAFGLSALNWISTRPHESVTVFEPAVARPGVAVVLLAIRWASHSYGDVKGYCEKYGKPMVYLTGGYNPNQVAHQILSQVGDRLRGLTRAG